MYRRSLSDGIRRWPKRVVYTAAALLVLLAVAVFVVRQMYTNNLRPVSTSDEVKVVVIDSGTSVPKIAQQLHQAGVIRQVWAFERYVRNIRVGDELQAGTYKFKPSQSVQQIVKDMVDGKVAVDLMTILPGQRIDEVRAAFIQAKFDPAAVDQALNPTLYADSPALADKPAVASLEGFLYPESYQKDASTSPETIVRQSLKQMEARLTPDVRAAFAGRGLSVYQAVTLASIVEREVSNQSDRAQAAQVFLKRLRIDMPLASDATAPYGAILAGQKPSLTFESPYNTYRNKGLPPGPISNVTESSIRAVANPASTDWTYFVSGDDGKTHFSSTVGEHEALTQQYCKRLCGN
ncbi:MAG TPA: endolytic transglycosylase MltG [Candidatus Limnocylindrales bacterium]|nr:endolytic transglycosylase MltG [Candidatus Limnocylindrales bacterium]